MVNRLKKKPFINIWPLLFIGLILRLWISFITYNGDLNNHLVWGKNIVLFGMSGFYARDFPHLYGTAMANYPPLAMISFAIMYYIYSLVGPVIWFLNTHIPPFPSFIVFFWEQQKNFLPAFIKFPAILTDLGTAYFIYLFIKKIKKPIFPPEFGAALVLFNPAFFYNSAYWGQIDSLPICFLLGSFYYLLFHKKHLISAFLFAIAMLSKQTVAVFIPLYLLLFIKGNNLKKIIMPLLISMFTFFIVFLPFSPNLNLISFAVNTYIEKVLFNFGSEYLTAHAFNFWGLTTGLGHIRDLGFLIYGIPARYIATTFVGLLVPVTLIVLHRRKYAFNQVIAAGYLIPFSMFLFSTRMHERHLLITIPFLLIAASLKKELIIVFLFISFFHFLNLYNGWWSPHPPDVFINFFGSPIIVNILIIISITIFINLFIKYIKRKS